MSFLVITTPAKALVVLQQVSVPLGVEYDDNPEMNIKDKQSVWRYSITPTYTISAVENQNRWFANAGLRVERSSDKKISIDREDPIVTAGWERELEKGTFKLIGNYEKNSIRDVDLKRSGLAKVDGDETTKSIAAEWTRLLTERLNLTLGTKFLKNEYSTQGFDDYTTQTIDAGLTYQLNERVSTYVKAGNLKYNPDNQNRNLNSQNYLGGVKFQVAPHFDVFAAAGTNHTTTLGNSLIANTGFNYMLEKHEFKGTFDKTVDVTSSGDFQGTKRLALGYFYDLSDKSKLGSDFSWQKNNFLKSDLNSNQTIYLSGYYTRQFSEFWTMTLSLEHRRLKEEHQDTATGETAAISFTYTTPQF